VKSTDNPFLIRSSEPSRCGWTYWLARVTDHYSRILHGFEIDGKAYGFAFDDVGHFEALVHDAAPKGAQITLTPF
jgi:hypothetical protein